MSAADREVVNNRARADTPKKATSNEETPKEDPPEDEEEKSVDEEMTSVKEKKRKRRDSAAANRAVGNPIPAKKRKVDESTPGGSGFQRPFDDSSGNQIDWLGHTRDILRFSFSFFENSLLGVFTQCAMNLRIRQRVQWPNIETNQRRTLSGCRTLL